MINITFPDGSKKEFPKNITGLEIANSISKSLAKDALVIEINGELWDLSREINIDAKAKIITSKNEEALEIIRHDAAHIMAEAIKKLYPEAQITIGPAIENGFYYDIFLENNLSENDLNKIEREMQKIVKANNKFIRSEIDRDEAIEFFKSMGENYKAEIIADIPKGEKITLYKQGDFIDLCRGPHAPSTGKIKHFKLLKIAGAYWRGDSKNQMLQRIYGTAFATKEELDNYLEMLKEAKKRDHRKLGKELDLFHIQEEAKGSVFWHHNGYVIYKILQQYIRNKLIRNNYIEVKTPVMVDKMLWEKSGHWEKFRDNMFTVHVNDGLDKIHALKPMNCPCHVQIFKQGIKSYRDLPIRMSEFGSCYRNESSGSLHGLLRVRNFVQDDGHIFCTPGQINQETVIFCNMLKEVYSDLGFNKIKVKFSDRPDVRAGSDEIWDKAEKALKEATIAAGLDFEINKGEGAFYGPKLEFTLTDAIGREWQCGTIQVDFVVPDRLDATYVDENGDKQTPVMLHRAIIGTFERFIGVLIEEYAGKFPIWLVPVQVAVVGVSNQFDNDIIEINKQLLDHNIRSICDVSNETMGYKIRTHSHKKIPFIIIFGEKEKENNNISIRRFGSTNIETISLQELIDVIQQENAKFL